MANRFSLSAQKILGLSLASARELGHTYIGSEHLLLAFLYDKSSHYAKILIGAGADFDKIRNDIVRKTGRGERAAECVSEISPSTQNIIENASLTAKKQGSAEIDEGMLFSSLLREKNCTAASLLTLSECKINEMCQECISCPSTAAENPKPAKRQRKGDEKLPTLQKYAHKITATDQCEEFDPLIGRDAEIERVMRILMRRTKNNPCLIGDPGVGKTAIVEGLARRIAEGNVPDELFDTQIYSLDLPSMLAGAKYRGDFEERMKLTVEEVAKNPHVVLFIDELHTVVGAGSAEGAIDAANIIKPVLARGKLRIIGATTLEEYRRHIEKDAAFERRFQSVTVREPSPEESVRILKGLRKKYEEHHGVSITDKAIEAAVKLSYTHISDRFLPDKAIDLIDESAARVKLSSGAFVCEQDVASTVTEWTGIPISKLGSGDDLRLINLESALKERIVGQDSALKKVCATVQRSKTGVKDPSHPLASFIFTGPSGVGKTSLARALACELYGSEKALIRLDMSEYCEKNSVSRLIGSPPGYIGYDDAGQLTERVRRNPHHIVLFDEIEKAHKDVFELLLQILDEGELSDSHGRKINFRNTIIIMTSNIGSELVLSGVGKAGFLSGERDASEHLYGKLKEVFSPEFIGRVDEIVLFDPLDLISIIKISKKMLSSLSERLYEKGIVIEFSEEIFPFIAHSCDRRLGAREIRRKIGALIETPLSAFILSEKPTADCVIRSFIDGEKVCFVKVQHT